MVLNHAETKSILLAQLRPIEREEFAGKALELTLGFDPAEFFFDVSDRDGKRAALGIAPEETVLVTCTRVNRRKNLERVIALVSGFVARGLPVRYVIVGFLGDEYEAQLKAFIAAQPRPELFLCFPFLGHDEIRKMYCAADVGIWLKAAISIQEAMGTGLPVVLEDREIVGHLVEPGVNGWYFAPDQLEQALAGALDTLSREGVAERSRRRRRLVEANAARLSYDSIGQRMIDGLAA